MRLPSEALLTLVALVACASEPALPPGTVQPQRIAALDFADEVLALGHRPCAFTTSWGVVRPYVAAALAGSTAITTLYGTSEPSYEAILSAQPDLILLGGATMRRPERLRSIAPTVILETKDPRQRLREIAAVLGVPERARTVLAAYEAKLEDSRRLLHQRLGNETVAVIRVWTRSYQLLGGTWMGPFFYQELGLTRPEMIRRRLLDTKAASLLLDPELLPELDADHLFIVINPQVQSDASAAALEEVPGWHRVPAVRRGNVYYVSQSNWLSTTGVVVQGVIMDEMVSAILREGRFARPADTAEARRDRIAEVFRTPDAVIRSPLIGLDHDP